MARGGGATPPGAPSSGAALGDNRGLVTMGPAQGRGVAASRIPQGDGKETGLDCFRGVTTDLRLIVLSVLVCLGASALPLIGSLTLLYDENYTYFVGAFLPWMIILIFFGVGILLSVTLYFLLRNSSPRNTEVRSEDTLYLVAGTFTSLLGILLLVTSLPLSYTTHEKFAALRNGCGGALGEARKLVYYNEVLHNIRASPACMNQSSVEFCAGWAETKQTEYLRYLENEFQCAPLCVQETFSSSAQPVIALLEQDAGTAGRRLRQGAARRATSGDPRGAGPKTVGEALTPGQTTPHTWHVGQANSLYLFQPGTAGVSMACFELISLRLQVLATSFVDLMFWEGFGLISVSIFTGMFRAVVWCIRGNKA